MNDFFACIALFQMLGWTKVLDAGGRTGGDGSGERKVDEEGGKNKESTEKYDTHQAAPRDICQGQSIAPSNSLNFAVM